MRRIDGIDASHDALDDSKLMQGRNFWDGSCLRHAVKELSRASWAIAAVDAIGKTLATMMGPVWGGIASNPKGSEYSASAAVTQMACGATTAFGDCIGVVRDSMVGSAMQFKPSRMHAGVLRSTFGFPGKYLVNDVEWVKDHTVDDITEAEIEAMPEDLLMRVRGNFSEDARAKEATEMYHSPLYLCQVYNDIDHLRLVHRLMAKLLRH